MKNLNVLVGFLSGAAIGAALGIIFAPDKGEETRNKIKEALEKKGIKLSKEDMKSLIDDIVLRVKGKGKEYNDEEAEAEPSPAE
jgi:gas vesicle protein